MWNIYRIYYGNEIVYVGRTNNINNRIRQHILSGKVIDVIKISRIEYAELETEADMNLYELYYILKLKPILNDKDIASDELNIELEDLSFHSFYNYLYEDWKQQAIEKQRKQRDKLFRQQEIKDILKTDNSTMAKQILENEYYNIIDNDDRIKK